MKERTIAAGRSGPSGAGGCVACQSPRAEGEARCGHCGVAVAPGGFVIRRQLAQGPYSRVFLAEKDGREVALKELLFALVPETAQLDAFEREAEILRQLNHPQIPRLVESFKVGEGINTRLYLAQEFVRGRSLLEELKEHRFDESEAKGIARALLEVLRYLHGRSPRVIHRDLKPANVVRRTDGRLALVDFGAARDLVRGATHGSTLVGTFGYMPPEQLGGTVDETSDLYALGATLIHLLARKPPDELLKPGMELAFQEAVNVSPAMAALLARLVERDRSKRFGSARAVKEALDALDRPAAPKPGAWRRTAIGLGALLGVLALALGGGQYLLAPSDPAPDLPTKATAPASQPAIFTPAAPPRETHPPKSTAQVITAPKVVPSTFRLKEDLSLELTETVILQGEGCGEPSSLGLERVRLRPRARTPTPRSCRSTWPSTTRVVRRAVSGPSSRCSMGRAGQTPSGPRWSPAASRPPRDARPSSCRSRARAAA
ncbi:MAG: serine/threonine protein kinase [Myxococcaceae bacterium]